MIHFLAMTTIRINCFVIVSVLLMLMCSCNRMSEHASELDMVDSLLNNNQKVDALKRIQSMQIDDLNKDEEVRYQLLLTVAMYKNYMKFTSDSTINSVVEYYKKKHDKENYFKALIFKGCVNEDLGNLDAAVASYHQAEELTDIKDTQNKAYAKLRLGSLYNSQYIGSTTIALQKYKEALSLYQSIGDKHYELVCLTNVGGQYRNIDEKHDSAVIYLKMAIKRSEELKDSNYLFTTNFVLSEYYLIREKDYASAIQYGLGALAVGPMFYEHPRAHYRLAESYTHLGKLDSALYYLNTAPKAKLAVDSIAYYNVLSQLEHVKGDEEMSKYYLEHAHSVADSVTIHGLNHRLLAVEKKYDLQQEELKNAHLKSRLWTMRFIMSLIVIAALTLGLAVLRYRSRLRIKEHEQELMRADLEVSVDGLQQMQLRLDDYKKELLDSEAACREHMLANETLELEQERQNIVITALEAKRRQSDELRSIINMQIEAVHKLMTWSHQFDSNKFAAKFRDMMTLPAHGKSTYWSNLQALVNDLHDNVLDRAQEAAGGALSESELNMLALYCCGFSHTAIMLAMGYKHIGTVYNKKNQITRKLGVNDLGEFLGIEKSH